MMQKSNISYVTIRKNKTLKGFMKEGALEEEEEAES